MVPRQARGIVTASAGQAATPPEPLVYSVEEAADLLGMGRTFVFRLLATGEIESFKIGNRRKIPHDALDGYIKRLRREQAPPGAGAAAPPQAGQARGTGR